MAPTSNPPLTVPRIAALKPGDERSDASSGLRVRVSPNGVRSFRWAVRENGRQRWITLGRWSEKPAPGHLTLAEARNWLERLKTAHTTGTLFEAERELRKAAVAVASGLTVENVAADFLKNLDRKRPEHAERPIEKDILPAIGKRPIASITSQDCRAIVESVVKRGSPTQAGVVLATLKQLFNFAVDRADLDVNPAARFTNPKALGVVKNMSQRVLSAEEITAFWRAISADNRLTPTVRNGLKILLLLGVRTGELLQAKVDEIDFVARTWAIPPAHQKLTRAREKTARPFVVPLGPTSAQLLEDLAALARSLGSPFLMASIHGRGAPLSEKALNHAMRQLYDPKKDPRRKVQAVLEFTGERPTPHDLRRTLRTGLGDLGVPFHIAERCLNHSLGKIAQTYDLSDYLRERRAALEKWDAHVQALIIAPR